LEAVLISVAEVLQAWPGMVFVAAFIGFALVEHFARPIAAAETASTPGRMVANFGLTMVNAACGVLLPVSAVAAAALAEEAGFGVFNQFAAPAWVLLPAALLIRTLLAYAFHRACHALPLLWRFHRVHHSDTQFDLSLALRSHPIEYLLRLVLLAAVTYALGLPVWTVVLAEAFCLLAELWEHTDMRLRPKWRRALEWVVLSPQSHRLHHSSELPLTDCNFGGGLVLWDRLLGTYRNPDAVGPVRLGLGERFDPDAANLGRLLTLPFAPG
jgi:sterol desaturase/sphingolipid hydroxylase (fatty acid hydroxylase superfamily)